MKIFIPFFCMFYLILALLGCSSDFLDAKPQKSLLIPSSLKDMEALLNNSRDIMNVAGYHSLVADGDFRIAENYLSNMSESVRISYVWSDQTAGWVGDWDYAYRQVFYANVVLQGLTRLKGETDTSSVRELKGRAFFYRAWALHLVAQQFAASYDKESAASLPGIPCPLDPGVNNIIQRGLLEETYSRIFEDLHASVDLLPERAKYITQPSKISVYALLARLYLITGDYTNSLQAAQSALAISDALLDYNTITLGKANSFTLPNSIPNPEVLYYTIGNTSITASNSTYADSTLYNLYEDNDLRKKLFFNNSLNYIGSYTGTTTPFVGLATDEIYLTMAECLARKNDVNSALEVLNHLLFKRYKKETFKKTDERNPQILLKIILEERRKELVGRGTAWMDLRRLNKEPENSRSLKRLVSGKIHTLEPNSKRYIMKIPQDEINYSHIMQNP